MSTIKTFNRNTCKSVKAIVLAALQDVLKEEGIDVSFGSGTFSDAEFSVKMILRVEGAESQIKLDFIQYAEIFGLSADDFGKSFSSNGEAYEIIGLKPNNSKYPVIASNKNGKSYKFPADQIVGKLSVQHALTTANRG